MTTPEFDRTELAWRISSRSLGGNCVEVAPAGSLIAVRHSRRPDAEMILYTRAEFAAFVEGAKAGEFDDLT
ncbi:DUF397 domain-containing protein [Krasilnikovia sp. M28-CT-15]|uniref:DUF397 domain-containing protein n=1 Tax=Krasilnikovia sp. M28-CT-15 TaxID=3373540 RepID=UPI0038777ACE